MRKWHVKIGNKSIPGRANSRCRSLDKLEEVWYVGGRKKKKTRMFRSLMGKRRVIDNDVRKVGNGQITEKYLIQDRVGILF